MPLCRAPFSPDSIMTDDTATAHFYKNLRICLYNVNFMNIVVGNPQDASEVPGQLASYRN